MIDKYPEVLCIAPIVVGMLICACWLCAHILFGVPL